MKSFWIQRRKVTLQSQGLPEDMTPNTAFTQLLPAEVIWLSTAHMHALSVCKSFAKVM